MNERIKLLAEQARKYAWENETHWSANAERDTLFEQKFARLIVRECAQWIVDNAGSMEHLGPVYFGDAMKKEFGLD